MWINFLPNAAILISMWFFFSDPDAIAEEMKDFIADNEVEEEEEDEEGGGSGEEGEGEKRKREDEEDELDDRLEDEDFDLIEENLGIKVNRKVSWKASLTVNKLVFVHFLLKSHNNQN